MSNLIESLTGLRPFGAILSMGRKGDRGQPVEKDRWHIASPEMQSRTVRGRNGDRTIEVHPPHPAFAKWHEAPAEARGSVVVELEHLRWSDSVDIRRKRQAGKARGDSPPGGRPFCVQTGPHTADRWDRDKGHHKGVRCLGDQCPLVDGSPATCRPQVVLYGRLVWDDTPWSLPSVSVRWRSHGWRSCRSILGVQQELDRLWTALVVQTTGRTDLADKPLSVVLGETGAPGYMVQGLRIRLRLVEHTGAGKRYPTVLAEPVTPLGEWLRDHADRVAEARGYLEGAERVEAPALAGPTTADPDMVSKAIGFWAGRGVDEAALVARVGLPVSDWTNETIEQLRAMAREGGA